jgi:glycosyltransferase involved in cell wall biosynthesis
VKTAIVHDWLTGMRGGEKCLEEMCRLFPDATVYTLIYRKGHLSPVIEAMRIRTSPIQRLPGWRAYYRHLLPFFPAAVESFDLTGYDLVISSSHCVAKGAVTGPETLHLCYCYTPMRYAWDQYESYFAANRLRWWERPIIPPLIRRLRRWDVSTVSRVDSFAAISHYIAGRIRECYGRESVVIYPPVDVESFSVSPSPGDHYLMVNALAPYKRVDIAIEAFNRLGRELRIVGTGQDRARLEQLAGKNIRFLGWISPDHLAREYASCKALIFPAEEDFGITPLEAQASGRPVIAFGRGGATETVRPHPGFPGGGASPPRKGAPTGVLFPHQSTDSLAEAVRFFEDQAGDFSPEPIRASVLPFDRSVFRSRIADYVEREAAAFFGDAVKMPASPWKIRQP